MIVDIKEYIAFQISITAVLNPSLCSQSSFIPTINKARTATIPNTIAIIGATLAIKPPIVTPIAKAAA